MRDFFEVQGKFYRELISGNRESNSNYTASFLEEQAGTDPDTGEQNPISASLNASFEDVARFLHINPYSASTLTDHLVLNGSTTSYEQELNVDMAKSALGNEMNHMPDNPLTYNGSKSITKHSLHQIILNMINILMIYHPYRFMFIIMLLRLI